MAILYLLVWIIKVTGKNWKRDLDMMLHIISCLTLIFKLCTLHNLSIHMLSAYVIKFVWVHYHVKLSCPMWQFVISSPRYVWLTGSFIAKTDPSNFYLFYAVQMGLIAQVSDQLPIRWSEGTCWDLQLPWSLFFFFLADLIM